MQVKENVNAANLLLIGSQAGNPVPKTDGENTVDFADFLGKAQNKPNIDSNVSSSKVDKSQNEQSAEKKPVQSGQNKEQISDQTASEKPTVNRKDNTDGASVKSADEPIVEETTELSQEETTVVLELIGNLLQNVMEQFHLSVEDLADKLEEFGLEAADLLSEEGLKDFFLQMNEAEFSDLLVDENLNQKLQSFMGEFEEVLQAIGSLNEDAGAIAANEMIADLLAKIPEVQELLTISEEVQAVDGQMPDEQTGTRRQEVSEDVMVEPEVIVTKEEAVNTSKKDFDSSANQQNDTPIEKESHAEVKDAKRPASEKQNVFENPILQAIQNAVDQVEPVEDRQTVHSYEVIKQVVEQVRMHMSQDSTSLEMQLYPEHLGKIQINVVSRDGIMTARIVAENEAAKQAIENGLTNLKDALQQQDLKVEAIEVMVSTTGFERGNEGQDSTAENQTSKNRRKLDMSEPEDETAEEDLVEAEKMKAVGSSVSYTA